MKRTEIKKIAIVLFLLALAFAFLYQLKDFLKNISYFIFSPLQKIFLKVKKDILLFFETIVEIKNLKKENEALRSEIKKLIFEKENLKNLEKENQTLREALSLGLRKEFKLEMVRFLGKDVDEDVFLIDKGKEDGIEEGQVVILPQKILVGKVMKVYSHFSKIKVFTFKNFSFDVEIGEEKVVGLAKGQGNFKVKIELIQKDKEVFPGQLVFTSGLGRNFPKGILVGEIKDVKDSDIFGFKEAILTPAFQLKDIDYFFVILDF